MSKMNELTERQKEIMKGIENGKTNSQIALELGISTQTVKNTLTTIYRKMNVPNRTSALMSFLRGNFFGT